MPEIDLGSLSFQIDLVWIILIAVITIAFVVFAINLAIRAHRPQASAGREDLIGKTAEVRESLDPKGVVFIQGERWAAVSELGRMEPGEEVVITKVEALKLYVTKK